MSIDHTRTTQLEADPPSSRSQAITALLLTVPAPSIGVLAGMYIWPGTPLVQIVFFVCKTWMCLLPAVWHLFVERKRLSWSPARHDGFGMAIASGLAIFGLIHLSYFAFAQNLIDVSKVQAMAADTGIGTTAAYFGVCAYWILVNSVLEEYVYRWFIFRKFEALVSKRAAVLLSAVAFTIHHILALQVQFDVGITVIASAGVFAGGVIWSWMYEKYRSIWPCWVSHAIVDVAIFVIGYWLIF